MKVVISLLLEGIATDLVSCLFSEKQAYIIYYIDVG